MRTFAFFFSFAVGSFVLGDAINRTLQAHVNQPQLERLGALCAKGSEASCQELVKLADGHCAGPVGSGCRFQYQRRVSVSN
jgi:hypothetical protein